MLKSKKDLENQELLVEVLVEKEELDKAKAKAKAEIAKNIKIPGFRKGGKIPANVLDKHISQLDVMNKAVRELTNKYSQEAADVALKAEERIFSAPEIRILGATEDTVNFAYVYPLAPELPKVDLKDLKTKFKTEKITDADVDNEIKRVLESDSLMSEKKGPAELGDIVNINFKGFIKDEPFEGGEAEGFDLKLGSKSFIAGFEDQLVGKEAGWEGEIKVTFPENYYVKEYRNVEAVFQIKINSVSTVEMPELNAETYARFGFPNAKDEKEFRSLIKESLEQREIAAAKERFLVNVIAEIAKNNPFKINRLLIEPEVKKMDEEFNQTLKSQGIKRAEYLSLTKATEEDIHNELVSSATKKVTDYIIYDTLVNDERLKVDVSQETLDKEYEKLSKTFNVDLEQVKQYLPEKNLKDRLASTLFVDKLIETVDPKGFETLAKAEVKAEK